MADSQWTRKFTWLMDAVEVKGVVRLVLDDGTVVPTGSDVGTGDTFDVLPDQNYQHLVSSIPGSGSVVHCETYPLDAANGEPDTINRDSSVSPWHLPVKPKDRPFTVRNPKTGEVRSLKIGDHVRLVGRWVIENGHPYNQRNLGIRRIGDVYAEFHPFFWDDITLVVPPDTFDVVEETLSLAAPTYTSVYVGQGKHFGNYFTGVASWPWQTPQQQRIYVNDDLTGFFNSHPARIQLFLPSPPSGVGIINDWGWKEQVLTNNTGLPLDQIRDIAVLSHSIIISATVTDPPLNTPGRNGPNGPTSNDDPGDSRLAGVLGNVNDPAYGYTIFQAKYSVWWRSLIPRTPS